MENDKNKRLSRRMFLKTLGFGGVTLMGMPSLANGISRVIDNEKAVKVPRGSMTYRTFNKTGERFSLLGYGCMRFPMVAADDGNGMVVDQNKVYELIDYAIKHGVNYFDTSPVYLQRQSETAVGKALSRYPRNSYKLATKMSNHHLLKSGITGDDLYNASLEMYRHSHEALKTDYFDNYLIHNVDFEHRGLSFLKARVFDNHLIDFILNERKEGRIRNIGFSFHGESREVFDFLMSRHADIHWDFAQIKMNYFDFRHAKDVEMTAEELYKELTARNIPVIIMEPLLGGKLATLPNDLASSLTKKRPNDSVSSWAFRFAGSFDNVLTVLSGMTYMEHLQDNLYTYSPLETCSNDEFALLENIAESMANTSEHD